MVYQCAKRAEQVAIAKAVMRIPLQSAEITAADCTYCTLYEERIAPATPATP